MVYNVAGLCYNCSDSTIERQPLDRPPVVRIGLYLVSSPRLSTLTVPKLLEFKIKLIGFKISNLHEETMLIAFNLAGLVNFVCLISFANWSNLKFKSQNLCSCRQLSTARQMSDFLIFANNAGSMALSFPSAHFPNERLNLCQLKG